VSSLQYKVIKPFETTGVPAPGTLYINVYQVRELPALYTKKLCTQARLQLHIQHFFKTITVRPIIRKGKIYHVFEESSVLYPCLPMVRTTVGSTLTADTALRQG